MAFSQRKRPNFLANVPRPKELGEKEKPLPIFAKEAVKERRSKKRLLHPRRFFFAKRCICGSKAF